MSRDELKHFYGKSAEFDNRFAELVGKYNEFDSINSIVKSLEPYMQEMGAFYETAITRDKAMLNNFIKNPSH